MKIISEVTEPGTSRYIPTMENPSDLGTRGSASKQLKELDKSERPERPAILEMDEAGEKAC